MIKVQFDSTSIYTTDEQGRILRFYDLALICDEDGGKTIDYGEAEIMDEVYYSFPFRKYDKLLNLKLLKLNGLNTSLTAFILNIAANNSDIDFIRKLCKYFNNGDIIDLEACGEFISKKMKEDYSDGKGGPSFLGVDS